MSGSDNSAEKAKKIKKYFKTAKTMALHGDHTAKNLMIESQYDRKKDLTNINKKQQQRSLCQETYSLNDFNFINNILSILLENTTMK
jgi:hypothetical protein